MRSTQIRPRIGFLVGTLDGYQSAVAQGARDAALAREMSFFCFVGGELASSTTVEMGQNHIFGLVSRENVDAVAIMSGAIGNRIGTAELSRLCARFEHLPVCTIAGPVEGIPNIEVNNREGLETAIHHLIRVHGRKKLAFIRGPEKNEEAQERYQVYVDCLAEHGIAFDRQLVVSGDYSSQGGAEAIRILLDERKLVGDAIDAIVAANDATAFGAIKALAERQIDVPARVAVIGFDDVEEARYSSPPLTTVRQPFREQGAAAVQLLWTKLQKGNQTSRLVLPTTTVFRLSCGCASGSGRTASRPPESNKGFEAALITRRDVIRAEIARAARGSFVGVPGWEDQLINSFASQLRTGSDRFSRALDDILNEQVATGVDIAAAHDVVGALRIQMLDCLGSDPTLRAQAEDLLHGARLATASAAERVQAQRRAKAERTARGLSMTSRRLIAVPSVEALGVAIREQLPNLGIASCYVSMFETSPLVGGQARMILAYEPVARRPRGPERFPNEWLAPAEFLDPGKSRAFVVISLYFGDKQLGIFVASFDQAPFYVYEALAEMLGAAMYGATRGRGSPSAAPQSGT
jgi:DNA-binding LacI/PurR family transcriptional regulator